MNENVNNKSGYFVALFGLVFSLQTHFKLACYAVNNHLFDSFLVSHAMSPTISYFVTYRERHNHKTKDVRR